MTTQELMFQILMKDKFQPKLAEIGDEYVVWELKCGWVGASNDGAFYLHGSKSDKYEVPVTFHHDVNVRIAHFTSMLHYFDEIRKIRDQGLLP